jgi:chromosome partitioning protein
MSNNCKIVAVVHEKGGTGKTTTTVNLGIGLARQGKTLFVDARKMGTMVNRRLICYNSS